MDDLAEAGRASLGRQGAARSAHTIAHVARGDDSIVLEVEGRHRAGMLAGELACEGGIADLPRAQDRHSYLEISM